MVEICKLAYINEIADNVQSIGEEELRELLKNLEEAECLILAAEGRSKSALHIGMGQIKKEVKIVEDVDFPGMDLLEAAPVLKKKYKKIALLINSSRGETTSPKETANDMADFIKMSGSNAQFTIDVVTSQPTSTIGEIGKKYGTVLELRGPKNKAKTSDEVLKQGIMNDVYELGSMVLFQKIKEALNEGRDHLWVIREMNNEMEMVERIIDQHIDSEVYQSLVEKLVSRGHATIGGRGPAKNVAEMTVIRLQHVKRANGRSSLFSGRIGSQATARRYSFAGVLEWRKQNHFSHGKKNMKHQELILFRWSESDRPFLKQQIASSLIVQPASFIPGLPFFSVHCHYCSWGN